MHTPILVFHFSLMHCHIAGGFVLVSYAYVSEVLSSSSRGKAFIIIAFLFAVALSGYALLAYYIRNWRILTLVAAAPAMLSIYLFLWVLLHKFATYDSVIGLIYCCCIHCPILSYWSYVTVIVDQDNDTHNYVVVKIFMEIIFFNIFYCYYENNYMLYALCINILYNL